MKMKVNKNLSNFNKKLFLCDNEWMKPSFSVVLCPVLLSFFINLLVHSVLPKNDRQYVSNTVGLKEIYAFSFHKL